MFSDKDNDERHAAQIAEHALSTRFTAWATFGPAQAYRSDKAYPGLAAASDSIMTAYKLQLRHALLNPAPLDPAGQTFEWLNTLGGAATSGGDNDGRCRYLYNLFLVVFAASVEMARYIPPPANDMIPNPFFFAAAFEIVMEDLGIFKAHADYAERRRQVIKNAWPDPEE